MPTMPLPLLHRFVLVIAFVTTAIPAQFVNRATWLGPDEETVRRDFRQGTGYFLDRFSYVVVPPWWDPALVRFHDRVDYRVGSTSATQFTIEGAVDIARELGDGFTFRYHWLQGENRDTRFLRNELGLDYAIADEFAVFASAEPFAEKSLIDVTVGAWAWRQGDDGLRLAVTAVDWTNEKSRSADYVRDPWAVMASGVFGDRETVRIAFELGAQLPFEVERVTDRERFAMERWIGSVEARAALAERDQLVLALEVEHTDKELRPAVAGSPLEEDFDREFLQLRCEWWRRGELPWSIGLLHTYHDEDGLRPFDPAADLRTVRREWFAIGRLQWRIGDRLAFEPQLFAGQVRARLRDETEDRDVERFEGKLMWNARWDFSPGVSLALVVGADLDDLAFGGGGAQFVARF